MKYDIILYIFKQKECGFKMGIYYTNHTIEAYKKLEKEGFLSGNESFVTEDFPSSYQWMKKQISERIENTESFPIWLWTKKPDLNDEGHFVKGTNAVCLTLEIPDNKVLLSDFNAWHCILNDWFCSLTEEEDDLFEEGKLNISKEQSWERIFDLKLLQNSEMWMTEHQIIQGVTPFIKKEQVLNIEYFIAK